MRSYRPTTFGRGRFLVEKELGRGGMGVVYRALDQERQMVVAIKTLLQMHSEDLYYFKKEFRALHDIVHPNLCSFLELIHDDSTWFFTMELLNGVDFLSHVRAKSGFSEKRLRESVVGLCNGLDALHAAGKVHRDIKPSNVLVTDEERVVLLDFGLVAERGARSTAELGAVLGSFAYMAPEQTDAQEVGPEADLYSVGVMLYEALTGKLPFDGPYLKVITTKQISAPVPPSAIQPQIPQDLERLCLDLLSIKPQDRPSASEIIDTMRQNALPSLTSINIKNNADEVFVGRNQELQTLKAAFKRATSQKALSAVVIEGVSGVGKSALVENFTSALSWVDDKNIVLKSRCYERESVPFKAFDGILESLIHHLRHLSQEQAKDVEPDNPELLIRLFPSLKRVAIFQKIPMFNSAVADPRELRRSSFDQFGQLLNRLASKNQLVIVIDDMQWADVDSISLLEHLVCRQSSSPLLLILISRIAEEGETSIVDWSSFLSQDYEKIHLSTLNARDGELLARYLIERESPSLARYLIERESPSLARYLIERERPSLAGDSIERERPSLALDPRSIAKEAAGHPLYIAELVQNLATGENDLKEKRIDDVIWNRVNKFSPKARQLLKAICVAGAPIEAGHLQSINRLSAEEFIQITSQLRAENLIRSRGPRSYHLVEPYHDRVREAVVAHDLKMSEAAEIQLNIGRLLLAVYTEKELDQNIFYVVQHLSAGKERIEDSREKMRLAELLYLAGKKARSTGAFVTSLVYFKESLEFFCRNDWRDHYRIMFELYCSGAESAYIAGDLALAKKLIKEAKAEARSNVDKAKILETYILSLVADGHTEQAISETISMTRRLGLKLVKREPSKLFLLVKFLFAYLKFHRKTKEELENLSHTKNKELIAARRLISLVADVFYIHMPIGWQVSVIKIFERTFQYGIDHHSAVAFGGWAVLNCVILRNYKEGYKYGKASLTLLSQFEDDSKSALVTYIFANFVQHWTEHIRAVLPNILKSYSLAKKTGNVHYLEYSGTSYCYLSFYAGIPLPQLTETFELYKNEIENRKQTVSYNTNRIFCQMIQNLQGECKDPVQLIGNAYNENEQLTQHIEKDQKINLFDFYQCKLLLLLWFGAHRDMLPVLEPLMKYKEQAIGTYAYAVLPFYIALAYMRLSGNADPRTKRKLFRRARKAKRWYQKLTIGSPANHSHKLKLLEAEYARLKGNTQKAIPLFREAINEAIRKEFLQDAALGSELAALFHRDIGDREKSISHAQDAVFHYEKWGALAKARRVKKEFEI